MLTELGALFALWALLWMLWDNQNGAIALLLGLAGALLIAGQLIGN